MTVPEVMVRGTAEGHLAPDRAALTVTVTGRDPASAERALAAAGGTADRVDALLDRSGSGGDPLVHRVRVSSVRVSEVWEHPQGRAQRAGFQAQRSSDVDCRPDGHALTDLVAALTAAGAQLTGPHWRVDDANPGWDGLRVAAVADARRRAATYAEAAGLRLGSVLWIAEPGLRGAAGPAAEVRTVRVAAAYPGAGDGEPAAVRIAVEDVPAGAEIDVAFSLVP
ncbi:MAG: SIMPL domain-containing protein [Kineosporiaceae bacterium]